MGGEPCADASTQCDDANDCTLDQLDPSCACSHRALPDGTGCDDHDACTQQDACVAGKCKALARTSAPGVVGSLRSFGASPGLQTLVAFPSPDRALFATAKRLTLLGLQPDQASVLDDTPMAAPVLSDSVGSMIWATRPRTFVIPVINQHVAIVSANWGIDLFDLTGDRLAASERYGFDPSEAQIRAAAGAGSRLFTCISNQLQGWSIDATNYLITKQAALALPTGHVCQGLALTPDANTLYAATSRGLDRVDVSDASGTLLLSTSARLGELVVDVQTSADNVAIFEVREASSGFGDVIALAADSLEQVATFSADLTATGVVPAGFSLLGGGGLLLQRFHADGCERTHQAALLALGAPDSDLGSLELLRACASPFITPSFHTVAAGAYASLEPMHQLVRLDSSGGTLTPLHSPQQGSFARVRAIDSHTLAVYGPGSTHRIDISNPSAPRVVAGGPLSPLDMEWLRLDLTSPNAPSFVTVADPALGPAAGPVTTLLRTPAARSPQVSGSIVNDDPVGSWLSSGPFLYQLSAEDSAGFRIRKFSASSVTAEASQSLSANLDQHLLTEPPKGLDVRVTPAFAVDPASGELVIVEPRYSSTSSGTDDATLSWFSTDGAALQRVFSQALGASSPLGIAIAAGRAVVAFSDHLVALSSDGKLSTVPFDTSNDLSLEGVLALDSNRLALGVHFSAPISSDGVLILRFEDFSEVARYSTLEPVVSLAQVGDHLAFGSKSSLSIATPACP